MKTLRILFLVLITTTFAYAQIDCRTYLPNKKGAKWEMTNFSAKGKVEGKITYEVVDKVVDGTNITFTIKYTTTDKKGKELYTGSYEAKCVNGVFQLDMNAKMDGSAMQRFENMDVTIDASKFELPDFDAAPGTTLEDGELKVAVDAGGLGLGMTVLITDRKVEANELLETSVGEYQCVVLTQHISTKMMIKVQGKSKEWYAEGIGLVRSESYNKKGKLLSYSEITKLII